MIKNFPATEKSTIIGQGVHLNPEKILPRNIKVCLSHDTKLFGVNQLGNGFESLNNIYRHQFKGIGKNGLISGYKLKLLGHWLLVAGVNSRGMKTFNLLLLRF